MYTQISDPAKMLGVLKEYLSDYNAISKKPMQLVLFQFALEHVSRICRIITSPGMMPPYLFHYGSWDYNYQGHDCVLLLLGSDDNC